MKSSSQNSKLFSWSAPPLATAVISLCVSACSVTESGSSLPPEVSKSVAPGEISEGDDEKLDTTTAALGSTKDKPSATDDESTSDEVGDSERDESVITAEGSDCRTVDDCPEGLVCVVKNGESICEKGVSVARGPLNQPPPPLGLLDGGVNEGSDAQ